MNRSAYPFIVLLLLAVTFIGCSSDDSNPVAPIPDPIANFTISGSTVAPATISFTNLSTNADSYRWDFGDGRTSILANPVMAFNSHGTFSVRLIASNATKSDTTIQQLTITLPDPVAEFTMTGATVTPATITFNNLSVNAGRYEWDFGDGRTSTQQNPVVVFNTYGVYEVKLVAMRTETIQSDEISKSLTISPGRVIIETVRIEQIPFVDGNGSGWDFGSGPDVFWSIYNAGNTLLAESDIYYENVAPADLPKTFTQAPLPYQLPNASAQYTVWLWDYDPSDANDLMVGGSFNLSDQMLSGNYVSEIYWDVPNIQLRMRVAIRWQ